MGCRRRGRRFLLHSLKISSEGSLCFSELHVTLHIPTACHDPEACLSSRHVRKTQPMSVNIRGRGQSKFREWDSSNCVSAQTSRRENGSRSRRDTSRGRRRGQEREQRGSITAREDPSKGSRKGRPQSEVRTRFATPVILEERARVVSVETQEKAEVKT